MFNLAPLRHFAALNVTLRYGIIAISLAFDTDYVGRTYLIWSFPARERNALNRNSPVFDELWFFVKDISNSPGGSEPAHLKFV